MSFENMQGFFEYFQKLWLESTTARIKSDFIHLLKSISEGKVACIEKTECIIFDAIDLIEMLPILSKMAKLTSVAIVEQFPGYIFRPVASISLFHRYTLSFTCIGRIV